MVQSHCGILCSECKFQKEMNCNTCLKIADPFWGECPIKACVKEKNLLYCGECESFPCDLINQFSYDKEQGDDGKRVETCRKWRDES